jgi:hypothetical protein
VQQTIGPMPQVASVASGPTSTTAPDPEPDPELDEVDELVVAGAVWQE